MRLSCPISVPYNPSMSLFNTPARSRGVDTRIGAILGSLSRSRTSSAPLKRPLTSYYLVSHPCFFRSRSAEGRREDAEAQKIREQITAIVDKAKADQGF